MRRGVLGAVLCGLGAGVPAAPGLAQPTAIGVEFQVNTQTLNSQISPAAAMDSDGDFVVVWSSSGADQSGRGILAQRFASSGAPLAVEFLVNTYTTDDQFYPAVAMDADGDFVVVWDTAPPLSPLRTLFAQRFDASGSAQATEFQVSAYTLPVQQQPSVAMDGDGDFVVAWASLENFTDFNGVFARRFDASGMPQAVEFRVDNHTPTASDPSVAMDGAGNFVIAYDSPYHDGSIDGIFARRFDSSGNALASELQVNTYTSLVQFLPSAAMDGNGDFVVAWASTDHATAAAGEDVFAQRFDASGNALGAEFQVNTSTFRLERSPVVELAGDGGFVVVWGAMMEDNTSGEVFARSFDAAGSPQGTQFQVNTYSTGPQSFATVAMEDNGDFVVAWMSRTGGVFEGQDGDGDGIFARRFAPAGAAPTLVRIDIRPGLFPNDINVRSNGKVKVAILTTSVADGDAADFDAFDVDPLTVAFGPAGAPSLKEQAEDVDFDGDIDLVLSFRAQATGIPCGATQATLIGETFAAMAIEASDSVVTHGC